MIYSFLSETEGQICFRIQTFSDFRKVIDMRQKIMRQLQQGLGTEIKHIDGFAAKQISQHFKWGEMYQQASLV